MKEITKKNYKKNREEFILEKCKNKKVLHLGCCDSPFTEEKYLAGSLLFQHIEKECKKQLGLDIDRDSISFLNKKKYENVKYFDLNKVKSIDFKPDIIIFGETLEHLMNLEIALSNLKKIMDVNTELIITVPNATMLDRVLGNFSGTIREHVDHKVSFTYAALKQLLLYNNFLIEGIYISDELNFKKQNKQKIKFYFYPVKIMKKVLNYFFYPANTMKKVLIYFFPLFSECLIFVVTKKTNKEFLQ